MTMDLDTEITELLASFRLPTASAEMVHRLSAAGHRDALPELCEVLRAEADSRRGRRVERRRKAAKRLEYG